MSLKAVEMQVALPRTHDAGQMQNQLLHKPLDDQSQLAGRQLKQTENDRKKSAKIGETAGLAIREQERRGREKQRQNKGGGRKAKQEAGAKHPYKGRRIDLTL
jgi:hypothetical protein